MLEPEVQGVGSSAAVSESRVRLVQAAVRAWKNALIDLSGRNNLLYFRDLKSGTLSFEHKGEYVDALLSGGQVRLSRVFSDDVPRVAFASRARTIRGKAREAFEERGLDTLFMAIGLATWSEDDAERRRPPAAPVVLVPVSLDPIATGGSDFDLKLAGEPRINPTLLRKLEADFAVPLAADEFDAELIDATSVDECRPVFARLTELAHVVPGFRVDDRSVLGTFSYFKLPMVQDLDGAEDELINHELIAALCGDQDAREALLQRNESGEPISLEYPDLITPDLEHLVLDADASQSHAINTVLSGRDLIVQGPPGTGKSQTIANLIAALVAEGKTVLFVAEKRAAIDAVFKRLRQVGLDQLLLDMHDGHKKRGQFAVDLHNAMQAHAQQGQPDFSRQQARLVDAREQLNRRSDAQHRVREPWGLSAFEIRTRLAGLPESAESSLRYRGEPLRQLGADQIAEAHQELSRWFELGARELIQQGGPWTEATVRSPQQAQEAMQAVRDALEEVRAAQPAIELASSDSGLPAPTSLGALEERLQLYARVEACAEHLDPGLFDDDLAAICGHLEAWDAGGWERTKSQIASADYRASKKRVREARTEKGGGLGRSELYNQLVEAAAVQQQWAELSGGTATPSLPSNLDALRNHAARLGVAFDRLPPLIGPSLNRGSQLDSAESRLHAMSADFVTPGTMAEINPLEDRLRTLGLDQFLEQVRSLGLNSQEAQDRLDYVWLTSILEDLSLSDPLVTAVQGSDQVVDDFQRLDREHIGTGPVRVLRAAAERAVRARDEHRNQGMLVQRQAALKPRSPKHLPVRRFFEEAPQVLQAIKPCWAMSPLVVSQTLPATNGLFDVVIFDEASQITPADAIPAMLRGKQLVVAGDTRQLPPTAFFVSAADDDEVDEDQPVDAGTQGFESILDALSGLVPERMLTWHYRSRDERLIAFSNAHIYDRSLTTFPGVHTDDVIRHELVPWAATSADPDTDSRSAEVERVVDLVMQHALLRPHESLGVIAMGIKHSQRIEEALRQRRVALEEDPPDGWTSEGQRQIDDFFDEAKEEPFFVKNLERVQGDERDAIVLTIGYGKEPTTGRMLYRFGPLLQDGGERRLNVAVTRAKRRATVVSSFNSADLDPERLNKEGAKLLRAYLAYAESEGRSLGALDELPPELNPFEIQVRDALQHAGMEVVPQHGVSGYRIDFAVKHPDEPGRYVLAVECDGATYHSAPTARARDRLRQEHLERLGWRFCRIWSTNWFNDRSKELERVRTAYQQAVVRSGKAPPNPFESAPPPPPGSASTDRVTRGPKPMVRDPYEPYWIRKIIRWVESDTLLRTSDELFWDTLEALGFSRAGKKIAPAIREAIRQERGRVDDIVGNREFRPTQDEPEPNLPPPPPGTPPKAPTTGQRPQSREPRFTSTQQALSGAADYLNLEAIEVSYRRKSGQGVNRRVINPLLASGDLLWAWCHKREDVRCFKASRIETWTEVSNTQWQAPADALARARARARTG